LQNWQVPHWLSMVHSGSVVVVVGGEGQLEPAMHATPPWPSGQQVLPVLHRGTVPHW
jgi:hypothetical protein